jgi:hypothetical protein
LTSAAAQTPFRRIASDFADSRIAVFGLALLGLIVLMAIAAPLISPQNPYDLAQLDVVDGRLPPGSVSADGATFWLGTDDQLRILVGVLRVAMMVPVEQAIILVAMRDHERRQMAHSKVERAAPERRLVGGLVHRHEQEGHQIALHDDQRQSPRQSPSRGDQPYQGPDKGNRAVMSDGAHGPSNVRPFGEFAEHRGTERLFPEFWFSRCCDVHGPGRLVG